MIIAALTDFVALAIVLAWVTAIVSYAVESSVVRTLGFILVVLLCVFAFVFDARTAAPWLASCVVMTALLISLILRIQRWTRRRSQTARR